MSCANLVISCYFYRCWIRVAKATKMGINGFGRIGLVVLLLTLPWGDAGSDQGGEPMAPCSHVLRVCILSLMFSYDMFRYHVHHCKRVGLQQGSVTAL